MSKSRNEGVGREHRVLARDARPCAWSAAMARYLAALTAAHRAPATVLLSRRTLRVFVAFLRERGVIAPAELRRQHLDTWHDFLREDYRIPYGRREGARLCANGVYAWLMRTLLFVRWLVAEDELVVDPAEGFVRPRHRRSRRRFVPTREDVERFLETIAGEDRFDLRDRAVFELLYSTGLRAGEASRLDVYDVDLAARTVHVRMGKGGYDRHVPLGALAAVHLERYLKEGRPEIWRPKSGDALFIARFGGRMRTLVICQRCRYWAARARLPLLQPHALRHAVATHMLAAGADVRHVQALLGHQHITTTSWYTHLVITDLVATHRRSHPRG